MSFEMKTRGSRLKSPDLEPALLNESSSLIIVMTRLSTFASLRYLITEENFVPEFTADDHHYAVLEKIIRGGEKNIYAITGKVVEACPLESEDDIERDIIFLAQYHYLCKQLKNDETRRQMSSSLDRTRGNLFIDLWECFWDDYEERGDKQPWINIRISDEVDCHGSAGNFCCYRRYIAIFKHPIYPILEGPLQIEETWFYEEPDTNI